MFLAHTVLIDTGGSIVMYSPTEPMDLLEVFQRFARNRCRAIVTQEGRDVARVSFVEDLDNIIEAIDKLSA